MADIEFMGKFFDEKDYALFKFGVEPYGPVQTAIDSDVITYMSEFMPFQSGVMVAQSNLTDIGSGMVVQGNVPYLHYQYMGELYVDPITLKGAFYSPTYGFWSRPNVRKIPSGKPLTYDKSKHPKAGPKWFDRMKSEYKQEILKHAQEVARKR